MKLLKFFNFEPKKAYYSYVFQRLTIKALNSYYLITTFLTSHVSYLKVLVNFVAPWNPRKSRVWVSKNWGKTSPLVKDSQGNLVPIVNCSSSSSDVESESVKVINCPPVSSEVETDEEVSNSQGLTQKPPAKSSDPKDKKRMGYVCQKCNTGYENNVEW